MEKDGVHKGYHIVMLMAEQPQVHAAQAGAESVYQHGGEHAYDNQCEGIRISSGESDFLYSFYQIDY